MNPMELSPNHKARIERSGRKKPRVWYLGREVDLKGIAFNPFEFANALVRQRARQFETRSAETTAQIKSRMAARLARAENNLRLSRVDLRSPFETALKTRGTPEHFRNWLRCGHDWLD